MSHARFEPWPLGCGAPRDPPSHLGNGTCGFSIKLRQYKIHDQRGIYCGTVWITLEVSAEPNFRLEYLDFDIEPYFISRGLPATRCTRYSTRFPGYGCEPSDSSSSSRIIVKRGVPSLKGPRDIFSRLSKGPVGDPVRITKAKLQLIDARATEEGSIANVERP